MQGQSLAGTRATDSDSVESFGFHSCFAFNLIISSRDKSSQNSFPSGEITNRRIPSMQTELVHRVIIFQVIFTVFGLNLFYDSSPESQTMCHIFILFLFCFTALV